MIDVFVCLGFQSPNGEIGNAVITQNFGYNHEKSLGFSPLTGKLVMQLLKTYIYYRQYLAFQSPNGEFGNAVGKVNVLSALKIVCFSPLTGNLVMQFLSLFPVLFCLLVWKFQSPNGEIGNAVTMTRKTPSRLFVMVSVP